MMKKKNNGSLHNCKTEVVCVGSELLFNRLNTDVNILAGIILKAGLSVQRCCIVADDKEEIKTALRSSLARADIIFVTGGLGPTFDDITRESISELLEKKLVFSEDIWSGICQRLSKRGIKKLPEINKRQAYLIEGSKTIQNNVGTAPGLVIKEGKAVIVLLPGPPAELAPMAECYVKGLIEKSYKKFNAYRFGITCVPESVAEEVLYPFMKKLGISYTILAQPDMVEIVISSNAFSNEKAEALEIFMKKKFGESYLGLNPPRLPEILAVILRERKLKLSIAESCTGGLAGKIMTDAAGSSDFFQGSFVVYSDELKKAVLKVPEAALRDDGAVSGKTALYMAEGAKKAGKADVSISFTGIAGPSGGTPEKPVGLVFIGLAVPGKKVCSYRFVFIGDRQMIRERAVYQGLELLRKKLIYGN